MKFPQIYNDLTEPLGARIYGGKVGCTCYNWLEKMGGYTKYCVPILESRMHWEAVVEKVRNQMNACNSNTIR